MSLTEVQQRVMPGPNPIVVHRRRLLKSTITAVRRPNFSYQRTIDVQFVGEDAEDYGGPRREFLR